MASKLYTHKHTHNFHGYWKQKVETEGVPFRSDQNAKPLLIGRIRDVTKSDRRYD